MTENCPTVRIRDDAERAEDLSDLRALLARYDSVYTNWQREFSRLLDESGLSYVRLAERSGLSRNTLRRWCVSGGAPRSRNTYIRLGFGLAMGPEETNVLLVRYGGYPGLYPRDLFDAVCLFLLERRGYGYDDAEALYTRCVGRLNGGEGLPETAYAASQIRSLTTETEFTQFVSSHGETFRDPHARLREFLDVRLRAHGYDPVAEKSLSVHGLFSLEGIPARFEKDISGLMAHGVVPRRERLIALGLRLELAPDGLDEMLRLAGMEPLCAKNRLECILIYALQQLSLTHPELTLESAAQLLSVARQPELQAQCRELIERYTAASFRSEPDDRASVAEYLRGVLAGLAPDEAAEFLQLL